jgi:hypothetical protein
LFAAGIPGTARSEKEDGTKPNYKYKPNKDNPAPDMGAADCLSHRVGDHSLFDVYRRA